MLNYGRLPRRVGPAGPGGLSGLLDRRHGGKEPLRGHGTTKNRFIYPFFALVWQLALVIEFFKAGFEGDIAYFRVWCEKSSAWFINRRSVSHYSSNIRENLYPGLN